MSSGNGQTTPCEDEFQILQQKNAEYVAACQLKDQARIEYEAACGAKDAAEMAMAQALQAYLDCMNQQGP